MKPSGESTVSAPSPESAARLEQEILADAQAKAERAEARARQEVHKQAEAQKARHAAERAARIQEAQRQAAEKVRAQDAATAGRIRRAWLTRREAAIQSALRQGLEAACAAPEADRRRALCELAEDALRTLGSGEAVLCVSTRDAALLAPAALDTLAAEAGAGRPRVEPDPAIRGGVLAVAADGRQQVDNTYAGRLRRLEPALRRLAAAALNLAAAEPDAAAPEARA